MAGQARLNLTPPAGMDGWIGPAWCGGSLNRPTRISKQHHHHHLSSMKISHGTMTKQLATKRKTQTKGQGRGGQTCQQQKTGQAAHYKKSTQQHTNDDFFRQRHRSIEPRMCEQLTPQTCRTATVIRTIHTSNVCSADDPKINRLGRAASTNPTNSFKATHNTKNTN